jgi:enamine deaminase RidA (YjgF/YER057c/UK114 family)
MKAIYPEKSPDGIGFTPAFRLGDGEQPLFVGVVTPERSGNVPESIVEQAENCVANLRETLERAGGNAQVVKVTRVVTDAREVWDTLATMDEFFGAASPTSTFIETPACSVEGARMEMEVWAVTSSSGPVRVPASDDAPVAVAAGAESNLRIVHCDPGEASGHGAAADLAACLDEAEHAVGEGDHVPLKLTVYLSDMRAWADCSRVIAERYPDRPPAVTPIAVAKLDRPGSMVEVEAWFADAEGSARPQGPAASLGLAKNLLPLSGTAAIPLFIGGQMSDVYSYRPDGNIEDQARIALQNYSSILEAIGATWDDVVHAKWYVLDRREWPAIEAVAEEHFGKELPPSAVIEISKLVLPAVRLEPDMWVAVSGA